MSSAQVTISGTVGGVSINGTATRAGNANISCDPVVAAAKTGTLTTRTDNDTGTLTMTSGHGITTGAKVDIYWSGGRRYNVTVGTVATNSVPFDLGSGDNLPSTSTAVTVMVHETVNLDFVGDEMVAMAASCSREATVLLWNSTTLHLAVELDAGEPWFWVSGSTAANPIAGDTITHLTVTHSYSNDSATIKFGAVGDV